MVSSTATVRRPRSLVQSAFVSNGSVAVDGVPAPPPAPLWRHSTGAVVIVVLGLALYLPGLRWGLPGTKSWSQDTIAGVRTLGAVAGWPAQWHGRYAPLHYLILRGAYEPVLRYWGRTGAWVTDPESGKVRVAEPHAPKIGLLILIARVISVLMAIGTGLGLWMATRLLTGCDLAAVLAAVTFMIGAAFTYFAHLGNVDVPAMCWFAWSVYFLTRLLRSLRWSDALLLGLFGSLAISTKDALAGMYPGMAVVILAAEIQRRRRESTLLRSWGRALLQPKWLAGILVFALPYLLLYGVFSDPDSYLARMKYWLDPAADTLHARQHRYPNQLRLLLATAYYAAGAIGWPMLVAATASVVHALHRHTRIALVALVPGISYYMFIISQIDFVYSRFLFAPISMVCILVGLAGAALWRYRGWSKRARFVVLGAVLLPSAGYALAISAEMTADSRYRAEAWFLENVPSNSTVGGFSDPQYLPRLEDSGYATSRVEMARESFDRPQPEYLIVTSYNYEDSNEAQRACLVQLLSGELGYKPVVTFRGRYLGTGSSWISIAGWGAPIPGKISPTITLLRRVQH